MKPEDVEGFFSEPGLEIEIGGPREMNGQYYPSATKAQLEQAAISSASPILWGEDLAKPLPPVDWLCEGLKIAPGPHTLLAGSSFSGKSLVMAELAVSVATGTEVFGAHFCKKGRVLTLDYDGQGERISRERLQRITRARNVDLASLGKNIGYQRLPSFYLDSDNASDVLCKLVDGFALLVIDSWRGATPMTDEAARGPVQLIANTTETISRKTGCVVAIVDHHVKPSNDPRMGRGAQHDVHGSSAKNEVCQAHFSFTGKEGEQETQVRQVKERVTGKGIPPFALSFLDVERDGDPRWGLKVEYLDREQLAERSEKTSQDAVRRQCKAILDALRSNPGISNADALAVKCGVRTATVRSLVKMLVSDGDIDLGLKVKGGGVRMYVRGMRPASEI